MASSITFRVAGEREFPWDMLRYDECWPANETESYKLNPDDRIMYRAVRVVELRSMRRPTVARWESFGWKVLRDN
jgi:hypothetical protein